MLNDIITSKKHLFGDGLSTVLRQQENRNRRVTILNGDITVNQRSEVRGINARVCSNGVYGFASVAGFTEDGVERVLRAATDNALFLDRHAPRGLVLPPSLDSRVFTPLLPIIDTQQKRIIEACRAVDAYIAEKYTDLSSRVITYVEDSMDKVICTSDAASGHITSPRCYIYVFMSAASKEGVPVELFKAFGGAGSFGDYFEDIEWMKEDIDALYTRICEKREGVFAEAGTKTVILGGMMAGMLAHEAVGHTVEADLVMGGSIAGPSLNHRVASDMVSLVDYAHTAFGKPAPLPVTLDDEGTIAEDAVLIENGYLKGYMNSRESAAHFGVKPQGNARGWIFSDEPLIRMRNTFLLPGKDTLEDMIASIDDGYYLIESGNGQADMTGEFMFGVSMGYEIKNGKLGRALLDTTVTGVAFEMLKTVDMVSDHISVSSSGFCGKKQPMPVGMGGPELRCKITIGGR